MSLGANYSTAGQKQKQLVRMESAPNKQAQIQIPKTLRHQSFSTKKRTQTVPAFQINQHHKSLLWLGKALYTLAAFRQAAARQRHGAPTPLSNVWPVAGFATMSNRHRFRRSWQFEAESSGWTILVKWVLGCKSLLSPIPPVNSSFDLFFSKPVE